jgi:hypothetical protein
MPKTKKQTDVAYSALLISDAHHPYVNKRAWELVVTVADCLLTPDDHCVIMGDFPDNYAVSDHRKDPRRERNFAKEINAAKAAKVQLESVLRTDKRHYIMGNHEDRLPRYLADKAPELYDLVTVEDLLDLSSWEVTEYRHFTKIGKLHLTHDVERCGKNAIQQSLSDFGGNLAFAHTHRGGTGYLGNIRGEQHACINVGWLGDLDTIDYKHRAKALREWQTGFGWVDFDDRGNAWCQFIPIIGNKCIVNGRVVKA